MNVAGAIVGSLAAGFLLLPALGSQASLVAARRRSASPPASPLLASSTAVRWSAALAVGAVASRVFGWRRLASPDPFVQFVAQRYPGTQIVWQEEGVEATVVVHQLGAGRASRLLMTINGNHEASTDGPMTFIAPADRAPADGDASAAPERRS